MYDTVIFDVDGTIIDSSRVVFESLRLFLADAGRPAMSDAELHFALGLPSAVTLGRLGFGNVPEALAQWEKRFRELSHLGGVFPGIPETLAELRVRGTKLALVTSKNRDELRHDFEPLGLGRFFEVVVCSEDTERPKPYPDPLVRAMTVLASAPASTLYVGDTIYDQQCAVGSGARFGLAAWGAVNFEGRPDHRLEAPRDILGLVAGPAAEDVG